MPEARPAPAAPQSSTHYVRFDVGRRLEHALLLLTFTTLAVTGLAQKFATSGIGGLVLRLLGGIELARQIHRLAAVALMVESIYHILTILYHVLVLRTPFSMLPVVEDFKHLIQDVLFALGRREHRARYGRYSYAEKVEYLAVVWGTVIMGITGFMMWNPIVTVRSLPGEAIPAAKAAHGGEAILAVLAILLWHFYHVHVRHLNKSMFTGRLTREEMLHEHPAELAEIEGQRHVPPSTPVIRRRMRVFIPLAILFGLVSVFGMYRFLTIEVTAATSIPPAEDAPIFAPQTPTPAPAALPSPTPGPVSLMTWEAGIGDLLNQRCGACHGAAAMGGLSLSSLASTLQGGDHGPALLPGDPDASLLVQVQAAGGHPGQLSETELSGMIGWVEAGAPER